jgi:hypothetical protein
MVRVLRSRLVQLGRRWLAVAALVGVALPAWLGATGAAAQTPSLDNLRTYGVEEVRIGALIHNIETVNEEDGVDLNFELLFRRPATRYSDPFLDLMMRPRIHLGTSLNLSGDTSRLYAGLTWDLKLAPQLSLELTFGGSLHDGPTGDNHHGDSYGCALNFRESLSLGYAVNERWTVYGTVAHMSNGDLCDHNTGLSSFGLRLGYKLR